MSTPARLIVVMAFDRAPDGDLVAAGEAQDFQSEDRAVRAAKAMADRHAGVIAWAREAHPDVGEYGPPELLFKSGDVPDME